MEREAVHLRVAVFYVIFAAFFALYGSGSFYPSLQWTPQNPKATMSAATTNNTDAGVASKYPESSMNSTVPAMTCQSIEVVFDLYVMQDANVVQLEWQQPFDTEDPTVIMEAVDGNLKHWRSSKISIPVTQTDSINYRYDVAFKEGIGKQVLNFLSLTRQACVKESYWRSLTEGVHQYYDIFHFPKERDRPHIIFTGQFFYVKMMYDSLGNGSRLKEHLIECEHVHFGHASFSFQNIDTFRRWVNDTAITELSHFQSVFLCSLLAQFFLNAKEQPNMSLWLSVKAADYLLKPLVICQKVELPDSTLRFIRHIAVYLLNRGTARGWLAYIGNFCHLFDVQFVIQEAKQLHAPYIEKQFKDYAARAITTLRMIEREDDLQKLEVFIISRAPTFDCLWALHTVLPTTSARQMETLSREFAVTFRALITHQWRLELLNPRTEVWHITPNELRKQLAVPFCEVLVEQVKKELFFTPEKLATLENFVVDENLQSSDHLFEIFKALSKSKQKNVLVKMIHLLNLPKLDSCWRRTVLQERKLCCLEWMKSFCRLRSATCPKDAVVHRLQAMEKLCQAQLVRDDKELMIELTEELRSKLATTSLKLLIDAYEGAGKLSIAVENIWTQLLKEAIKKDTGTGNVHAKMKKMVQYLKSSSSSERTSEETKTDGAKEEILVSILDLTQLAKVQNVRGWDGTLKAMLKYQDIWQTILGSFNEQSRFKHHPDLQIAAEALKFLKQGLNNDDIHVGFLLELKPDEIQLLGRLCALIKPESKLGNSPSAQKKWVEMLTSARQDAQQIEKTFVQLESSIHFLKMVAKDAASLTDLTSIFQEVNKRKEHVRGTMLGAAANDHYWGPLLPLKNIGEGFSMLEKSVVFRNVARSCLKRKQREAAMLTLNPPNHEDDLLSMTVEGMVQLLWGECQQEFNSTCDQLLEGCSDLLVMQAEVLFSGLVEPDLKKELAIMAEVFGGSYSKCERIVGNYLKYPILQRKAQLLISAIQVFDCNVPKERPVIKELKQFAVCCQLPGFSLAQLSHTVDHSELSQFDNVFDEDMSNIVGILNSSSDLLKFMKDTAKEDIIVLIDAVEEHSDHFVSESVVSDLIDVHKFLRNILINVPKDPWDLARSLRRNYDNLEKSRKSGMDVKITVCSYNVHSLRGLYMNVANREEMTKEKISNALSKGSYQLGLKSGGWEVILSYHRQDNSDKVTSYGLSELLDLRSRALLIMNTDKKRRALGEIEETTREKPAEEELDTQSSSIDLSEFVAQVDYITDILQMCEQLHTSGHPEFEDYWKKLTSTEDIRTLASSLTASVQDWEHVLDTVRKEYLYLNYFHANQLWVLSKFFGGRHAIGKDPSLTRAAVDLLRFIDTTITLRDVEKFMASPKRPKRKGGHKGNLRAVGQTLENFFEFRKSGNPPASIRPDSEAAVKPKELFVAVLEEGSTQSVHVVMSLFENTTGSVPQPSQILFCHSETNWEEVERLLRRAFVVENLHCLANVECLPNDMQFGLVAAIKMLQSNTESHYLLSLVCRGRQDHPIVDQFSHCAHHIGGMTEAKLKERLCSLCPDVCVVTSDLPGLGKTEIVHEDAASKKKAVLSFPISGPLSRKYLVKRLSAVDVRHFECIHFDIGEVDDPLGLDTFLFELIVLGLVTAGTELFHIPTRCVYIEIANTLNNWLRDSLSVTKSFTRKDIKWKYYKNYLVSQEVSSPVQVVCHYLQAKENGTLENKDLIFSGTNKLQPLPPTSCRRLLGKFFSSNGDLSFNVIESFINVFSHQLLQFSASPYFKPHNLKAMMGQGHDVRNRLFTALFEVSSEFASRSVSTCKAVQSEAISEEQATEALRNIQLGPLKTADQMVSRVDHMIQWADNNHLLIVFHSLEALSLSVTALYRDVQLVPPSIKDLFASQAVSGHGVKILEDFAAMTQAQLQRRLERIACTASRTADVSILGYALTPDNILKMALIIQRIRVNIPVIVMGETGCGKTSLVRYLARTCGVPFRVFNFHAGIKEQQIIDFIQRMDAEAEKLQSSGKSVWVFLDEINTCDFLGTINEIICHNTIQGRPLSPNLVFIAACNPYRIRTSGMMTTAGLSAKAKADDECSKLVYRVHPLPETMIDYVWDYGSLKQTDERAYIGRMVEGLYDNKYKKLLIELLSSSQEYIRKVDSSSCCVSLRDVHRCTVLMKWFHKSLLERKDLPKQKAHAQSHLEKYQKCSAMFDEGMRSVILALAHCYHSRLSTTESRTQYKEAVAGVFKKNGHKGFKGANFVAVVRVEQEEYLARMELPEGTAINAALRENVFVMLVCILNHIPVFVVGKPGCSKSLSMQVIRSNLRGKDAKDPFLKKLPQLYVVSFQGSKSSTSEGIEKVFEKARKYKSFNKTDDVLPVVLLDEIGLAEDSKHNPLKVLHSLLEPGDGDFPDVAVVGISNWALDPAKMNRANHLSRPEPNVVDLYETGQSIQGAQNKVGTTRSGKQYQKSTILHDHQLRCLAEAYHESQKDQDRPNFHGLRDYYSLVKNLSASTKYQSHHNETGKTMASAIHRALHRNFGGLDNDCKIQRVFQKKSDSCDVTQEYQPVIVTDLISDNLFDKTARHLMLITSGDSAIGILDRTLENLGKEKITIFGSRLEEDLSEDYSYRILSRIILCMERDCVLILRDLENIYGSLYDMLNQNYTVVGGRKNCRIALGPFSNPMCQVHDGFRCIVLMDHQNVERADPPFLNRFEKQILRFSDVLDPEQHKMIEQLQTWVTDISTSSVPEVASHFDERDMFVGFHEDTLPSLVLHNCQGAEPDSEDVIEKCKQDLMWVASPDGVLRSLKSEQAQRGVDEVASRYRSYFEKPIHNGLRHFLSEHDDIVMDEDSIGMKWLIMTHSNIHTNVLDCLDGSMKCQAEKLSSFKSEKQLTKQLQKFWDNVEAELLVLQCKPDLDATHMLLAKSIIEQQRAEFTNAATGKQPNLKKHVCIIVHEQRVRMESHSDTAHWQFNFLSGWRQVTVDVLEKPIFPITSLLDVGLADVLNSTSLPFKSVMCEQLMWCFMQIKYQFAEQLQPEAFVRLIQNVQSSPMVIECFKELTCRWIEERSNKESRDDFLQSFGISSWQISVASDRQALLNSSTLTNALERYISHLVRRILARIIYFLERESAWHRGIRDGGEIDEEELQLWVNLLLDKRIFDIDDIPEPQGAESYLVCRQTPTLQYPFSHVFFGKIESVKEMFVEGLRTLHLYEDNVNEDGELRPKVVESLIRWFSSVVEQAIPWVLASDLLTDRVLLYIEDLLDIKSTEIIPLSRDQRVTFLKAACAEHIRIPGCGRDVALLLTQLHSTFWMEGEALNSAIHLFMASRVFAVGMDEIIDDFTGIFEMKLKQDTSQHDPHGEEVMDETEEEADALDGSESIAPRASRDATTKKSSTAEEQHPFQQSVAEVLDGQEEAAVAEVCVSQTDGDGSQLEKEKEFTLRKAEMTDKERIPEGKPKDVVGERSKHSDDNQLTKGQFKDADTKNGTAEEQHPSKENVTEVEYGQQDTEIREMHLTQTGGDGTQVQKEKPFTLGKAQSTEAEEIPERKTKEIVGERSQDSDDDQLTKGRFQDADTKDWTAEEPYPSKENVTEVNYSQETAEKTDVLGPQMDDDRSQLHRENEITLGKAKMTKDVGERSKDAETESRFKGTGLPEDGEEDGTVEEHGQTDDVMVSEQLAEADKTEAVAPSKRDVEQEREACEIEDSILTEEDAEGVCTQEDGNRTKDVTFTGEGSQYATIENEGGQIEDMRLCQADIAIGQETIPDSGEGEAKTPSEGGSMEAKLKDDQFTTADPENISRTEPDSDNNNVLQKESEREGKGNDMGMPEGRLEDDDVHTDHPGNDEAETEPTEHGANPVEAIENEQGEHEEERAEGEDEDEGGEGGEEEEVEVEETSQLCFKEALINSVCVAMFPTQSAVNSFGSVSAWCQTASLLLSMMSRMSSDVPAFHFLRVCHDYASMVVVPESLEPSFGLYGLGSLGQLMATKDAKDEAYLDSHECFDHISELVDNQPEFLVLFYSRCIQSNPDTPVRGQILHTISTTTDEAMLQFVGPVIHCILWTEEETSPGAFEVVLQNPDALCDYPGLVDISTALDVATKLDLPFVVMCCDLIGEVTFREIDLTTVSGSEDRLLINFRTAATIVAGNDENQDVFRLLCAVAYLRSILSSVARLIQGRPSFLFQDGESTVLPNDVNAAITASESSSTHSLKSTIRMFLLKELRTKFPLYELRNLCTSSVNLPALQMVKWQDDAVGKLSFDPFRELTQKTPAAAALANLLAAKKDEGLMTEYLQTLKNSCSSMLELAALLIKVFYLIRSLRNLRDTEVMAAGVIVKGLKSLPEPYEKLVIRTVGKEDFEAPELNISPESPVNQVHRAALVLHLGAILASHSKCTSAPFSSYFTGSMSKKEFVLAAPGDIGTGYQTLSIFSPQTSTCVKICLCSCSVAFVNGDDKSNPHCSSCQSKYETKTLEQPAHVEAPIPASRGYNLQSIQKMQEDTLHVRQLGPVEFRMLHLLVHTALFAGYALQLFKDAALQKFMSNTANPGEASKTCFQHIENDLRVLCNLLDVEQEDALHLMHCVLDVTTPLLAKSATLTTEDSRRSWEKTFAEAVGPLLQETNASRWKLNVDESCQVSPLSVESQPDVSDIQDNQESPNLQLACLFRVTQPKTFNRLRAFYMNSSDQVKTQHPLLALFLDYHHILPLITHLESFLNWNRIVDSRLSRRLSRKEAKLKIGDVIRGECTGSKENSDKKSWKNAFDDFKLSWEEVRPLVKKKLGRDEEVPHLSETSPVAYSLIERKGDGIFLCTALKTLLTIQNEFVEKVVAIASSGDCAALSFLHKEGKSVVPVVHVQDASKKEIIHYQWSDELVRYSQRDTKYGRGSQIFYDLRMIEKELAVRFLIGKAYLSTRNGLREFIFSKELFHTCSDILNYLQQLIPPVCLTYEMKVGLMRVKDHSLKNVQDLLEHLEIVLCLLKRLGGNPEQPLVEFTDLWLSSSRPFPNSLLPEPRTGIQLKHVVSLYEFLEDQLAQSSAESVLDTYREPVIEDVKNQMAAVISSIVGKPGDFLSIDAIITALQRFMFRYMSSEDMRPNPGGDLSENMMDPSLWPMGSFNKRLPQQVVRQVIPSSLTIGHVYSVLSFYQEHKKSQSRKRGTSSQLAKGGIAQKSTRQKKRTTKKFQMG